MFFGQYAPWENYPKKLRHFEVVNPLAVITDFFSANLLGDHHKKLKKWRIYAVKDKVYKDKRHGPGSLLFFYDMNVLLLEAAYLLYYNDGIAKNEKVIVSAIELEVERKLWEDFPENLSHKEMNDPYQAVKKVFRKISLQQYREYLHEWLYAALYSKGGNDELEADDIKVVYKNLLKLYSAAWLIFQRENKGSVKNI